MVEFTSRGSVGLETYFATLTEYFYCLIMQVKLNPYAAGLPKMALATLESSTSPNKLEAKFCSLIYIVRVKNSLGNRKTPLK
jgi:hypothetical protein